MSERPSTLMTKLRKELDEAGIGYWAAQSSTFFNCPDGRECMASEYESLSGSPRLMLRTEGIKDTKQIIAATLERTTTRHGKYKIRYGREVPLCEICGYGIRDERYNFCPKCGARIVED